MTSLQESAFSNFTGLTNEDPKAAWVETFTGRHVFPLNPRKEDIALMDIAHGLSHICRFTGQTSEFWSVAQHSLLVDELISEDYGESNIEIRLAALLHDATEAYLSDIARPLKLCMPQYKEDEARLEAVIADRFNMAYPWPKAIKKADTVALTIEAHDLMPSKGRDWHFDVEELRQGRQIRKDLFASPKAIKTEFLRRVNSLLIAKGSV
jgi:5'-deoxynucleotidase YfbR-like HD superfamily hydrolase